MAANIVQTKFDKVKSFMDNGSFVFTYSKTKPIAIHKDQLFRNQLYDTSLDETGLPKNKRINSEYLKHERIEKLVCSTCDDGTKPYLLILYTSKRLIIHNSSLSNDENFGYTEITLPEYYKTINGEEVLMNEKISNFSVYNNKLVILTNLNRVLEGTLNSDIVNLTHITFTETHETAVNVFAGIMNGSEEGFFIYTSENNLYFYNAETSVVSLQSNIPYIKDIKSAYGKTFIILKTGKVICNGLNVYGDLGLGNMSDEPVTGFTHFLFENVRSTDPEATSIINMPKILDIGIGKKHTVFITETGRVFGFGKNEYKQLAGSEDEYVNMFNIISYPREYGHSIKCTPYGTIILSFTGKLIVTGLFVSGEFTLSNNNGISISVDGTEYTRYYSTKEPIRISRIYESEVDTSKLTSVYYTHLYNTYGDNLFVAKDNGKVYYTGQNRLKFLGDAFGDNNTINIWTSIENDQDNILRRKELRQESWTYFFDLIMKNDKSKGNSFENIFYKHDGVWIDWIRYIERYINISIRKTDGTKYPKYKEEYDSNGNVLKRYLNYDSFISYLNDNSSIIDEFKIDKRLIPSCDYIDSDLNVWKINAGDNISCKVYTQELIDTLNRPYTESLNNNLELKATYEEALANTDDPDEIVDLQDKLAIVNLNINDLNTIIESNQSKLNTISTDLYLDFNKAITFNPNDVVGTETKTKTYTRTVFNDDGTVNITTVNGVSSVEKESVTKTVDANITKLKMEFINYDHLIDSRNPNDEVLRDDIKLSIQEDPNDETEYDIDDFMVWLGGKFVNVDKTLPDDENKAFYVYNGMSGLDSRTICEFPGLGEPTLNEGLPTLGVDNATVYESNYPTEVRFDARMKTFGWQNVKIAGPYHVHNTSFVNSELTKPVYFYFGDVYCSVFSEIRLLNQIVPKNTFLLFMNGAVVDEDEYDVYYDKGDTYIKLKSFTEYVVSLLQDYVDISKPGYIGKIKHILSMFDDMQPFSIAFLRSTEKFKKVKVFYDYQNIRNYPKPGQVLFRDIKYNDLVLVDGFYIPYLWESKNCIKFPETNITVRSSENNFMNHSSIYKIRPYTTYKSESEMDDRECRDYALETGLINTLEYNTMEIGIVRDKIRPHLDARIKDI